MKRILALAVLLVLLVCTMGGLELHAAIVPLPTGAIRSGRTAVTREVKDRDPPTPGPDAGQSKEEDLQPFETPMPEEPSEVLPSPEPESEEEIKVEAARIVSPDAYKASRIPDPEADFEEYYIKVNYRANTVTVYGRGESGEFDRPLRAMICSTGDATPENGVFRPGWRLEWQNLFYGVYGQFVIQITGNILFHSVPYQEKFNKSSLEYWEYDKLGTAASAGCVRLQVKDAKWLYDRYAGIVAVEFYGDENPGPLGKPTAPTISGEELRRGWDPTDPDEDNFWLLSDEEIYLRCPWLKPEEPTESRPLPGPKKEPETK